MLSKNVVIVALVALVIGLTVKSSSVAAEEFPIFSYGCANDWDGGGYREYLPQVDSCGFNIILQSDFDQDDFDVANAMGLRLIRLLSRTGPNPCPWLIGQKSWYEGDGILPIEKGFRYILDPFDHSGVVGREKNDPFDPGPEGYNQYARYASADLGDVAGWMQRGLKNWHPGGSGTDYNNEQDIPWYSSYHPDSLDYYVHFRLRTKEYDPPPTDPLVTIYAVICDSVVDGVYYGADTLAQATISYSDFTTPGEYQDFSLTFTRTKDDKGRRMDYPAYWHGNGDIWLDRVMVEDANYDTLLAGGYDEEIQNVIDQYEGNSSLYRWYIWEPADDQFLTSGVVNTYLKDHPSWAPGFSFTCGAPSRASRFMDVVGLDELFYFDYFFDDTLLNCYDDDALQYSIRATLGWIDGARVAAQAEGRPFWYLVPAYSLYPTFRKKFKVKHG